MKKKAANKELMTIGAVSKKLGIHEQTIRTYEREGLLKPFRSEKNTRYYSNKDVTRIFIIVTLTQEFGFNRAGVNFLFSLAKNYRMKDEDLLEYIEDSRSPI